MAELASVTAQRFDDIAVASIQGEIDLSNAETLFESLMGHGVEPEVSSLVVDLTPTTYIDSSGIRALFELADRLTQEQTRLITVVPEASPLRRVMTLAQADEALALSTSVEDALAALGGD